PLHSIRRGNHSAAHSETLHSAPRAGALCSVMADDVAFVFGWLPALALPNRQLLPADELLRRQHVARTRLIEADQPTAYRRDDFGFAAIYPIHRAGGRQIRERKFSARRPDDIALCFLRHCYSSPVSTSWHI